MSEILVVRDTRGMVCVELSLICAAKYIQWWQHLLGRQAYSHVSIEVT